MAEIWLRRQEPKRSGDHVHVGDFSESKHTGRVVNFRGGSRDSTNDKTRGDAGGISLSSVRSTPA